MNHVSAPAAVEQEFSPRSALNRLDHSTLRVDDLDASVSWYEAALDFRVLTRDRDRAILSCGLDNRADLVLQRGGTGIESYTFGVENPDTIDATARHLDAIGVAYQRFDADVPGIDAGIEVVSPSGVRFRIGASNDVATGVSAGKRPDGVAPIDTDHVTLTVPDVRGYAAWLSKVFDFHVADAVRLPGDDGQWIAAWTHVTDQHHDVAMTASPAKTTLNHIAFLAEDLNHMGEVADRVCSLGPERCEWGIGKHGGLGANNFLYFRDPAGNRVEINSNMASVPFELETALYAAEDFSKFVTRWTFNAPPETMLEGS